MKGRILIVAGSDSGGGAGIQADIKAVTALGGYAMTAITALTAQNTLGVFGIHAVPDDFIRQQMELTLDDIGADAVKTGMLHSAETIHTVVRTLAERAGDAKLVVDPVMVAKGGARLLQTDAVAAVRDRLLPIATIVTPNLPEAETLLGRKIASHGDMAAAAADLLALGPQAVLLKGGHLPGSRIYDLLATRDGAIKVYENAKIDTPHTHGTGCTLASAIACGLAQDWALEEAVARAREYVQIAIQRAPGFGKGHGPLDHTHTVSPFWAKIA